MASFKTIGVCFYLLEFFTWEDKTSGYLLTILTLYIIKKKGIPIEKKIQSLAFITTFVRAVQKPPITAVNEILTII